jgi:hypothetical protein
MLKVHRGGLLIELAAQLLQQHVSIVDLAAQRFADRLQFLDLRGGGIRFIARLVALGRQFRLPLPHPRVEVGQLRLRTAVLFEPALHLGTQSRDLGLQLSHTLPIGLVRRRGRLLRQSLTLPSQVACEAIQFTAAAIELRRQLGGDESRAISIHYHRLRRGALLFRPAAALLAFGPADLDARLRFRLATRHVMFGLL